MDPTGHECNDILEFGRAAFVLAFDDLFGSLMFIWGLTTTAACDCGAEQQTPDHVLYDCPIYKLT